MQAYDAGAREPQRNALLAQMLIWGGVLLLGIGGLLTYPYLRSRVAPIPALVLAVSQPSPTPRPVPSVDGSELVAAPVLPAPSPSVVPPATPTPALPSRVVIPAVRVDAPIVPISWITVEVGGESLQSWNVPATCAAGWHETSVPLGVPGNTVLNGHNTTQGEVFRDLYRLRPGDTVLVYSGDMPYAYVISEMLILPEAGQPLEVRLANARYVEPTGDERLTLVTCHPYGSLRFRLIVIARPVAGPGDSGRCLTSAGCYQSPRLGGAR